MSELHVLTSASRWYAHRHAPLYPPEGIEEDGWVETAIPPEIDEHRSGRRGRLWLLLRVDQASLTVPSVAVSEHRVRIFGPLPRRALEVEPLRTRTASDHTLYGVLTPFQLGLQTGNPGLLQRLDDALGAHRAWLYTRLSRELPGSLQALVEDLVQETLAVGWVSLDRYRPDARFRTYLWAIARQLAANARRKHRDALTTDGVLDDLPSDEASVIQRMEKDERDRLLERVSSEVLAADEREIAHLRYGLDLAHAEIRRRTGLEEHQVRAALQRIVNRLKKAMAHHHPG